MTDIGERADARRIRIPIEGAEKIGGAPAGASATTCFSVQMGIGVVRERGIGSGAKQLAVFVSRLRHTPHARRSELGLGATESQFCHHLLCCHLESVALIAILVDTIDPDVVLEDLAVLYPELVIEMRCLPPRRLVGDIVPPSLQSLA